MVQDVLFNPSTSFNPSTRCGILWNQKVRQVPVPVDPRQWTPMAMARSILRQSLVLALGSSGILWDPLGASRYFFIEVPEKFQFLFLDLYHFISFYTDIYTLQPNAQRWRGLRMFTPATAGVHGHDAGRQCRGQECGVRILVTYDVLLSKTPRCQKIHIFATLQCPFRVALRILESFSPCFFFFVCFLNLQGDTR